MYFYEILHACKETVLTEEFLKLCTDSPDLHRTREVFMEFLKNIKSLVPEISDEWTLFMSNVQTKEENYEDVYAKNAHAPQKFGIEITPWKEVLGWAVDTEILSHCGREAFTAAVLWEITWFGYDEETIQARVESREHAEFSKYDLIEPEGDESIL